MSDSKKCNKCGHVAEFDGTPQIICPACMAFYSNEAATSSGSSVPPRPAIVFANTGSRIRSSATPNPDFVAAMRAGSLYPNFRSLARLVTWFFYLVGVLLILGAIFSGSTEGMVRIGVILGSVIMMGIATAAKEASLMLADLSDATVCIAQK